jgi:hypothetical protein
LRLAQALLFCFSVFAAQTHSRRLDVQYTIEARELTSAATRRPLNDREPRRTTIEAEDADQAISRFLVQRDFELVSMTRPARGKESIATVKSGEAVYLVRVYAG